MQKLCTIALPRQPLCERREAFRPTREGELARTYPLPLQHPPWRSVGVYIKGIAKGGVKNRNKGGCKRLFAFVHFCSRLLAFACVCASAFAFVCQRLSAFVCVCSHLLTPPLLRPPLRDTDILGVCQWPLYFCKSIATSIFLLSYQNWDTVFRREVWQLETETLISRSVQNSMLVERSPNHQMRTKIRISGCSDAQMGAVS